MNREKNYKNPVDDADNYNLKSRTPEPKERLPFSHIPEELALDLRDIVEDLVKRKQVAQEKIHELEGLMHRHQLIVETINVVLKGFQQLEERQ